MQLQQRKRALRKRGIVLASGGWALALVALLAMRQMNLVQLELPGWWTAVAVTAVVQALLWLIPHRGWDERLLSWDRHYVLVPTLAAALLLGLYTYLAPRAESTLLLGWFVALVFLAGLADAGEVVLLSGVAAVAHAVALAVRQAQGLGSISLLYAGAELAVFLASCAYAALVFRRLRRERAIANDLRRELVELAVRDPLTDLPNRRHFEDLLRSELARLRRYGGSCCVAMIDVDHFKAYNDTLGHVAGDDVLRELARVLAAHTRESDVVARYGGEEFAILLIDTPADEAHEVLERLRRAVEAHPFPHEDVLPTGELTISAGIASCSQLAMDITDVIDEADRAMYAAKHAGRNRVADARVPRG